jgi:transposase
VEEARTPQIGYVMRRIPGFEGRSAAMVSLSGNEYRRLKPRRGHKRALGAVKHTLICVIWHMLCTGENYRDLGDDYFTARDPERQTRRLVAQLERLGHHVTLQEAAPA